jgi:hypothetical protein
MPALFVPIISAFGVALGGASGAFLIMYAVEVASALFLLGGLAYSSMQQRKAKKDARNAYNAAQVDRLANVPSTVAPRELVLGRVRKGGQVFFRGTTGANKEKFVMLIALASHEIDAVESIYLNDQLVTLDVDGYVESEPYSIGRKVTANVLGTSAPGDAIEGSAYVIREEDSGDDYTHYQYYEYAPKARIRWALGTPGQAADSRMMTLFPTEWTAAHQADNVAYLICEFDYDETAFPSGLPNVTAVIRGAKLYDPRSTLTEWSENPALMARHIMMHPQFGKRTALTAAETARITAAANACDVTHDYGDGSVEMYRASIVLPYGASARDALDDLTQAMAGSWAYAAGEFYIRAGVYVAPVKALGDDDLAVITRGESDSEQPISISTHRARNEKINIVTARIWDADQGYKQVALTPIKSAELITRDGAELMQEVDMQAVFYSKQALHVAGILMRDMRDPLTVTLPFKLTAYEIELFDNVTLTLSRYGWSSKIFSVLGRTWSHDGKILLTLKETAAAIYQPDASFSAQGYAANTTLPNPWEIDPPTISSIASSTAQLLVMADGTIVPRVLVTWDAITDFSVTQSGHVEVQWQVPGAALWNSVVVPATETQAYLVDVRDQLTILIRARTRNAIAVSDWSLQKSHEVIGKTEPPENVTNFFMAGSRLTWTAVSDVDLAGYRLRFHYGTNLDWGTAAPLHTGLITSSPFDLTARPSGAVTILIKAVDTSGNESVAATTVANNLGDAPIANVVATTDFDALGYTGTLVNCTVSGGNVIADALDSAYGTDSQSFYGLDADSAYESSSYAAMTYTTADVVIASVLAGSIMTLEFVTVGTDVVVEYNVGGGAFIPWPGQITAAAATYKFRISIGAGPTQGQITSFSAVVDAPDIVEYIGNVTISSGGTVPAYVSDFTYIATVTATLQANGSGAVTVEVDKTTNLSPSIKCYDVGHVAVSGANVDLTIKGY